MSNSRLQWLLVKCYLDYFNNEVLFGLQNVFEDAKGEIRSRKLKDRQYHCQKKRTNGQTMIYKT